MTSTKPTAESLFTNSSLDKLRKIDPVCRASSRKRWNVIKLNANENPYPPAPGVTEVLRTFDAAKLAVYPDANAKALKTALAEREGLSLRRFSLATAETPPRSRSSRSSARLSLSSTPTLPIRSTRSGVRELRLRIPYETVPLDENFCINLRDYDKPNGGVTPCRIRSTPTGRALSLGGDRGSASA